MEDYQVLGLDQGYNNQSLLKEGESCINMSLPLGKAHNVSCYIHPVSARQHYRFEEECDAVAEWTKTTHLQD